MEKSPSIQVHRVTDPFFLFSFKSTFSLSQTVGEKVFVSLEVEKMRTCLVQSIIIVH